MRFRPELAVSMAASAAAAIAVAAGVVAATGLVSDDERLETSAATTTAAPSSTTTATTAAPTTTTTTSTIVVSTTAPSGRRPLAYAVVPDDLEFPLHNEPSTTTTTAAPTTTVAGPAPVRIPRPACADGLGGPVSQTAPYTGRSASIPAGLPAVVVKVSNNNSSSRAALIGLDQADLVFEERIEASATRFAAVFHSSLPANVGPVRSGRTTDIQIMRNLGTPVLGYSGSNNGVAAQLLEGRDNGWFVPFVNTDRAPFARDGRYRAPDNLFVDPTSLGACGNGGTPYPVFRHGEASSTTAQPAAHVALTARSPYRFDWDAATATWLRSQDGWAHATRTGARLAPSNVVVLFVRYVPSAIDRASVDAETIGSGDAWTLRDGTITVGSWSRTRAADGYTLLDGAGTEVTLAPGSTWVVLAPGGSATWG